MYVLLSKFSKVSTIASFVLAIALVVSASIGRSATNAQQVAYNTDTIKTLKGQIENLQQQIAQQEVIANELKNVKENQDGLKQSIDNLANELHSWQRDEYRLHHSNNARN